MTTTGRHRRRARIRTGAASAVLLAATGAAPLTFSGSATAATDSIDAITASRQTWDRDLSAQALGGSYATSATPGDSFIFRFAGAGVTLDGYRAPDGGQADVLLDGVRQGTVSFYAGHPVWRTKMFAKGGLDPTRGHSLQVVVRGDHQPGAAGNWVNIDAVQVSGQGTFQEDAPSVQMNWSVHHSSQALDGTFLEESHVARGDTGPAPYTDLSFVGTQVALIGCRGPSAGIANIYLDGKPRGAVDLYQSFSSCGDETYESPPLPRGAHTIRLEVPGFSDAQSHGTAVSFDGIAVLK